jgi:enoyl-CoA hydratase
MLYQFLNYQKMDNVTVIYIDEFSNDRTKIIQLSEELVHLYDDTIWDKTIRVVIITDAGDKSFFIGADSQGTTSGSNEDQQKSLKSPAYSIAKIDRPVIAVINKDAIGQGLELAIACDIRIASETSRFGLPQIRAGHIPWDGGTQRLSRLVGKSKALEMILTGEVIDAQEALRIGLVNKVVPKEDLMEVTMKMAQEMASKGPIALRYAKEAIYKGIDMTLEQGLRLEADLYLLIHTSKDRSEGIQAFREKRKPKFEGK